MIKIHAHRGASGYMPENTLLSFQMAVDLGANGIECDIHRTADGQLLVCHDATIDRTSDGTGAIKEMTLEEKALLVSGHDMWTTNPVERLGIPSIFVSDGPHGLRKQDTKKDGDYSTIKAVCFPAACATASSFDRGMMYDMGVTLGKECQAEDVSTILGPAINIKRSPLCGRNFEYMSEDPYLNGTLAVPFIKGVQECDVAACVKHFAVNNQETDRLAIDTYVDERALREIYLPAFKAAIPL